MYLSLKIKFDLKPTEHLLHVCVFCLPISDYLVHRPPLNYSPFITSSG